MKRRRGLRLLVPAAVLLFAACSGEKVTLRPVSVAAGIDPSDWDRLLKKYVDERGLVAYEKWKASPGDLAALDGYLAKLGAQPKPAATGKDLAASLVNAYNAFAIRWILQNYPTPSIRSLDDSFTDRRHRLGGRAVSLDEIEHATLRPLVGFRVHAAVVCAARSCPPLSREAYDAKWLDLQLDRVMRQWLSRDDLNRFLPLEKKAEISSIFRWFAEDFEKAGGLRGVLKHYARFEETSFLESPELRIEYLLYDWGLNDQGELGRKYGRVRQLWDRFRDGLR
jgi:hypothetical protein